MKKKVSSRNFFSHTAGLPEIDLFLWTAWGQFVSVIGDTYETRWIHIEYTWQRHTLEYV